MGTTQAQCLLQLCTAPSSFITPSLSPNTFNNVTCCRFARSRSDAEATSSGRFRFYQEDDDGYDFRSKNKQRVWWSDIDDDDDDWDVEEDDQFWLFEIFRNFGWMLPAVAVSALLGNATGPNTILMALAVPLGQTLLSLVIDKVWAGTTSGTKSRSKRKTKRKPFRRATTNNNKTRPGKANEAEKASYEARGRRDSYQSWAAAAAVDDVKEGEKTRPNFGGWDELDKKAKYYKANNTTPRVSVELPKQQKDRLSRRGRIRDRPLLVRLLIAVFPFLGSWTKLLF